MNVKPDKPDWSELDSIVKEWKPELFIVGNPLNMDGSDSKIKEKSDKFSKFIKKRYCIPFELIDERLTTKEAIDRKRSEDGYIVNKLVDTHGIAAQIILESWFREKN